MTEKKRILFLSANPWTTSRILVDEEAREIFERIQEGPYRDEFELHKHLATRPVDLQRLLLLYQPHIVHFSGHGTRKQKIILGGAPGRGKTVDRKGLADVLALYNTHVRLVVLNACFTKQQARSISEVIDYAVGTGQGIGDKAGVAFAGAFYRALGFGKSTREAFESAKAELGLTRMPRTLGLELFVRKGISEEDSFPRMNIDRDAPRCASDGSVVLKRIEERSEFQIVRFGSSGFTRSSKRIWSEVRITPARRCDPIERRNHARLSGSCGTTAASHTLNKGDNKMAKKLKQQAGNSLTETTATALRRATRKAPGTRVGTLEDWREAKSAGRSGGSGKTIRDGR